MSNPYIVLPVIFQLFVAVTLMFSWTNKNLQKLISVVGSLIALLISILLLLKVNQEGIQTMQAGGWIAPFGITFVADTLSALLVLLTAISGLAVSVFSVGSVRNARIRFGYFPILHLLIMGLSGAFLTGDIFNLYVWFEIIIISSFVLITIGGEKAQLEGAIKYVAMNLLASVVFLTAIAILYGLTGSLNMADLSLQVAKVENRGLVNVTAILFLVGFGIKSAVFPLYFWLPASYHTPPPAISAIFGGLLTKVGVYAMLRVFTLIFIPDTFLTAVITIMAMLTIFSGAVGALMQNNIRKVFSYLIICHIGFMLAGLGVYSTLALAGAVFYLVHDIVVKTNLFMISGLIFKFKGTYSMRLLGGFYKEQPLISLLIAISLFSLVGIPPLSGFWGKLLIIQGALDSANILLIGFIVLGSFLTLFIIARLWSEVFWKDPQELPKKEHIKYFNELKPLKKQAMLASVVFLSILSLGIGFGAEWVMRMAMHIAENLMDPSAYIQAVLGT
ncbi:proton-conducting transporter transmembrane domain-containing protein [Cyclobacterium jeungdonense]|uniref:Proton-conducting transporter membrane subunit n=1 Tax=Cyclobacterium jeungdonense TaxID=708087 RepID=A0ABT8C8J5_9BACT|nr:proton-conducting transporter membrane subunit [Cyclobacterium jeungdonense]MDN3689095.1 proton-conducting transporter membrane subunit [Cyclobacterium jeungdonense]